MQKTMIGIAAVALVCCCVLVTPVGGEPQITERMLEVIEIEVTAGSIGYVNKDSRPIPELTFGSPFNLTVHWVEPSLDTLTLSEFRLVAFDPTAHADGRVIWPPDPDYRLELQDEHGTAMRSVTFSYSEGGTTTRTLILERVETGTSSSRPDLKKGLRPSLETPQLILFTISARAGETQFVLDPPWVGKPPVG